MSAISCSIQLAEPIGLSREKEQVRGGVPFARSMLMDISRLSVTDHDGRLLPFQAKVLERWPDRSLKWVLLDCLVDIDAVAQKRIFVNVSTDDSVAPAGDRTGTYVREEKGRLLVDTGKALFTLSKGDQVLDGIEYNGRQFPLVYTPQICLLGRDDNHFSVENTGVVIEETGELNCILQRQFRLTENKTGRYCNLSVRYQFYQGSGLVRMEVTLHNPSAASHPGGLWDLGDKGSICFKEFSLRFKIAEQCTGVEYQVENGGEVLRDRLKSFFVHQNSSGGENWDSPNHVDRNDVTTVSFRGYSFKAEQVDGRVIHEEGVRAAPWLCLEVGSSRLAVSVEKFWQNFPKSIRFEQNQLQVALFPSEQGDVFELQGGERKRHVVWLEFGGLEEKTAIAQLLDPIQWHIAPEWVEYTKAVPFFTAQSLNRLEQHQDYIQNIIAGDHSFFAKRYAIDEYGWRNYGDTYADHEAVNHLGSGPFISHYNNQYDFIYGACMQYLGSGDQRWWELAVPAAQHMIDIDIYHTKEDKAAYNGGLFWHTDHYQPAGTATHRAYSRKNKGDADYGGGTSNEHIYTSGLCLYYLLTGDVEARYAVVTLAEYVLAMDDGKRSILSLFDERSTGLASQTVEPGFHHPGRGGGNSINCLVDAYRLTGERRYFDKAEELLQRCIHPADDVAGLNLNEPEYRWSYLVFLQVLGKYLSYKVELGERDYRYFYARDSLLTYAAWMKEHEVPYNDVLDKVLIPTETWPAQDIRKAHVFYLAAEYGPETSRDAYREKALFFFERSLEEVLLYKTAFLTRPLVLHCVYRAAITYFHQVNPEVKYVEHNYAFGAPVEFHSQRQAFKRNFIEKLKTTWRAAWMVLSAKYGILR